MNLDDNVPHDDTLVMHLISLKASIVPDNGLIECLFEDFQDNQRQPSRDSLLASFSRLRLKGSIEILHALYDERLRSRPLIGFVVKLMKQPAHLNTNSLPKQPNITKSVRYQDHKIIIASADKGDITIDLKNSKLMRCAFESCWHLQLHNPGRNSFSNTELMTVFRKLLNLHKHSNIRISGHLSNFRKKLKKHGISDRFIFMQNHTDHSWTISID